MHLVVISCTPRMVKKSNTAIIIDSFKKGYEKNGNTTEVYYLSQRSTWETIREAFYSNAHILFAIPLFVECVPGLLLEFLEDIEPKKYSEGTEKTKIGFILQGGFAEASQLRCCERYLERLPGYLNCDYTGTLVKGNMFALGIADDASREKLVQPFVQMGEDYALREAFIKEEVSEFARPEYFSKGFILLYTLLGPLQKTAMGIMAKKLGCKTPLNAKPYQKYLV